MEVKKKNAMLRGSVKAERKNLSATSFCRDSPSHSFKDIFWSKMIYLET
jgi:hypothetical protein